MADDKINPGFVDPDSIGQSQPMPEVDLNTIGGGYSGVYDEIDYGGGGRHSGRGSKAVAVKGERLTNQQNADRWKHRRRMAYMSLVGIFVATLLLFFVVDESRIKILSEPIVWFYICMSSITGSYLGFATWDQIKDRR
mgnify:FL=1